MWKTMGLLLLIGMATAMGQEAEPAEFVGDETCVDCHDDYVNTRFLNSYHRQAMGQVSEALSEQTCESCHGPGSIHMDDPDVTNILTKKEMKGISETCAACHQTLEAALPMDMSEHAASDLHCLDCHSAGHHPPPKGTHALLRKNPTELCSQCHQEQATANQMPFAHRDGGNPMACIECHQVHQSQFTLQNAEFEGRSPCVSCHDEKAGPFVFEHPVRHLDGCGDCHQSHGSPYPFLLNRPQTNHLCLECHTDTPAFHNLSQTHFQSCVACHTAVHGSNRDHLLIEE